MSANSPVENGLKGLCPECGEGALFSGFLTFAQDCQACDADFTIEDAGDGPAVFVIFAIGIFIIPMALAFSMITKLHMIWTIALFTPIIVIVSVFLLRLMRGVMFNLQWANNALEHKAVKHTAAVKERSDMAPKGE